IYNGTLHLSAQENWVALPPPHTPPGNESRKKGEIMSLTTIPKEVWAQEVKANHDRPTDWLWQGFIARGNTTLLTGTSKPGKPTVLSLLLSRRKEGGSVGGIAVKPGKTLIITEENLPRWAQRMRELDFGDHVCFLARPFLTIPTQEQWQALLKRVLELRA